MLPPSSVLRVVTVASLPGPVEYPGTPVAVPNYCHVDSAGRALSRNAQFRRILLGNLPSAGKSAQPVLDDAGELVGVEAGAADERAVDVRLRHELGDVL